MDKHSLEILELDKIKRMLASCAASDLGRDLALALSPSSDLTMVQEMLSETSQMKEIFARQGRPPFGRISDIRPLIKKASLPGSIMEGRELVKIAWTTSSARELKAYFLRTEEELDDEPFPIVSYLRSLNTLPELKAEIAKRLDDEGNVADNASPKLAKLRSELRVLRGRIVDRLNDMIAGQEASFLQEPLVTMRNGRYVLPVKRDQRSAIKGIVHDQSASGSTLYIEPISSVETNNRIQIVLSDIDREVLQILSDLTSEVGSASEGLNHLIDVLARLDFIWARASLSLEMDGEEPRIHSQGEIDLIGGRHPLLEFADINHPNEDLSGRGSKAVPVDISLGGEGRALVITGPNTGGKTVALKLVGLLTLMAQAGLHIPAKRGSSIRPFSSVYADIGDEQSIEQNISTFSSHAGRIATILDEAGPGSLVLLDEIGAGTDPIEGAALSQAILEHLHRKGATTVATTHYGPLKKLAFEAEWAENAAVQFDLETLRPTYRLSLGVPGSSHALYIADRLGLPKEVVSRAQELLGSERLTLETLIQEIGALKEGAESELRSAQSAREEAEELRKDYHDRMNELSTHQHSAAAIKKEAYEEARKIIDRSRSKVEETIETIRLEAASRDSIKEAHRTIAQEAVGIDAGLSELDEEEVTPATGLNIGSRVRITNMDKVGYLIDEPGDRDVALVQVGTFKVQVAVKDLQLIEQSPEERKSSNYIYKSPGEGGHRGGGGHHNDGGLQGQGLSHLLDIRGLRVEEALPVADKYLDDAVLMGVESVRIVHGQGTGALRSAIVEMLKMNIHVANFRPGSMDEGGIGVTVARLK